MTKKSIGLDETGVQLAFLDGKTTPPEESDYTSLGKTYKDTCYLKDAEPTSVSCECEETDEPEDEYTIPGNRTVEFETTDMDPESCYKIWGGTLSVDKREWDEPNTLMPREVSVKYRSRTGLQTKIGRGVLTSWRDQKQSKTEYGRIKHRIKVMTPKIAGMKKFSVIDTSINPTSELSITSAQNIEIPAAAKSCYRTVAVSNGDKGWTVTKDDQSADWLTVSRNGERVAVSVTENTQAQRSSTYTITSGIETLKVTVTQAGV